VFLGPNITNVLHGRKFRYAVDRIDLGVSFQNIPATKVRNAPRGGG
jgi:hypothetical protein